MDKKIIKYSLTAGVIVGIIAAVVIWKGDDKNDTETSPEATVEAFYHAVSKGDFTTARELCDTVSMKSYLNSYEDKWETLKQMDSTAAEIAAMILSNVEINFIRTDKDGDRRQVQFLIDATMGMKKKKTATLKKEKKGWRVETITDAA